MSRDDILAAQEDELTSAEEQQAQEEAHHHFVGVEFGEMILYLGPNAALSLLDDEAKSELKRAIITNYNSRLVEATCGG